MPWPLFINSFCQYFGALHPVKEKLLNFSSSYRLRHHRLFPTRQKCSRFTVPRRRFLSRCNMYHSAAADGTTLQYILTACLNWLYSIFSSICTVLTCCDEVRKFSLFSSHLMDCNFSLICFTGYVKSRSTDFHWNVLVTLFSLVLF